MGQTDFDSDGKLVQYFAMIEDITVKKNVFQPNRIWKKAFFLIRNLQTGVVLEDENRKVVLVNKTFCTMFDLGKDSEMLIGTDDYKLFALKVC
jgi:PAS domain-containing protein